MTADQWLLRENMVGRGGAGGAIRKAHKESFGVHGCVHYLDCSDVFMEETF